VQGCAECAADSGVDARFEIAAHRICPTSTDLL